MNILQLLASDGCICVNKHILKILGLEEAVLLGELASIYNYNRIQNTLTDDWFYATVQTIQEETGLSDYKQQKAIHILVTLGIIEQKTLGMPRKRLFRINKHKLFEFGNEELWQ